jgi:hypothetical protein
VAVAVVKRDVSQVSAALGLRDGNPARAPRRAGG